MPLESATYISELVTTNPAGSDAAATSDDHHRLIKSVLRNTFPNANGAINPTPAEFNLLVGLTGTIWTSDNDGAGSGLDADLLRGLSSSVTPTQSTVVIRAGNGSIEARTAVFVDSASTTGVPGFRLRDSGGSTIRAELVFDEGTESTSVKTYTSTGTQTNNLTFPVVGDVTLNGNKVVVAPAIQTDIGSAAVGQAQLKTTYGQASTTTQVYFSLPGGAFGFMLRLYSPTAPSNDGQVPAGGFWSAIEGDVSGQQFPLQNVAANTWGARVLLVDASSDTSYLQQHYIQASPPYDLGDGEIPRFIFAIVDSNGNVESVYQASEAPWHYNGPTNVKADFYRDGKGYRLRRDMSAVPFTLEEAKADPAKMAEYVAAFNAAPVVEEEITQEIKNRDMALLPHPFLGNELDGKTVVLLDPVCDLCWHLAQLCECHDEFNLNELLHDGHIRIDNSPINRAGPPGVPVVGFRWK